MESYIKLISIQNLYLNLNPKNMLKANVAHVYCTAMYFMEYDAFNDQQKICSAIFTMPKID